MASLYNNNSFYVNSTGLYAQNYSLSSPQATELINPIGYLPSKVAAGGKINSLSCNYLINLNSDPHLNLLGSLITGLTSYVINFGGSSGTFYLDSFGFNISPVGKSLDANVQYINYHGITGGNNNGGLASPDLINYYTISSIGAGLTYTSGSTTSYYECTALDYSFKYNLKPRYKIGSKEPYDIGYLGYNEVLSMEILDRETGNFYGSFINSVIGNAPTLVLQNEQYSMSKSISLSGYVLSDMNESLSVNDIVRYKMSFVKNS